MASKQEKKSNAKVIKIDGKSATVIAKKYFEETKTTPYFLFESKKTEYNQKDNLWIVNCEVKNIFDEKAIEYMIKVDANSGEIKHVERIK